MNWYRQAVRTRMENPNAMSLATATRHGVPSIRYVLYQAWPSAGLTFYTNYGSDKARELDKNPRAACGFYWRELGRQVRVEGRVARLSRAESEAYFAKRPRGSQLSAWASPQSRIISRGFNWSGRTRLQDQLRRLEVKFRGAPVPCPPFWGGFALRPDRIEFWKSGVNRFHYRMRYERHRGRWTAAELAP